MDTKNIEVRLKYTFSNPSHRQVADAQNLSWKKDSGFSIQDILLFTAIVVQFQNIYSPLHVAIAAWHKISLEEVIAKDLGLSVFKLTVFSDSSDGVKEIDLADPRLDEVGRRAVLDGMHEGDYVGVEYSLKAYVTVDCRSWV